MNVCFQRLTTVAEQNLYFMLCLSAVYNKGLLLLLFLFLQSFVFSVFTAVYLKLENKQFFNVSNEENFVEIL
jgi:F0F1-type ATP synthase membrane subunit a